jgi:hypothetical protein
MLKEEIRGLIKRNFIDPIGRALLGDVEDIIRVRQNLNEYIEWVECGKPVPPPDIIKQITVKTYANKYGSKTFVETGTYLGDMVFAVRGIFNRIYSVELGDKLYENAKARFSKHGHISILHGNSAELLPEILRQIKEPCLFWLDAHYSAGITAKGGILTPILQEIKHIFGHPIKDHIILIDDAADFNGENDYPTVEELRKLVLENKPNYEFGVKNNIIRIHRS